MPLQKFITSAAIPSLNPSKFSLTIQPRSQRRITHLTLFSPVLNTRSLPSTFVLLEQFLPSIYSCLCFNDSELPFKEEVLQTEVGHLFEHILIEYLCQMKMAAGEDNVSFEGETSWNWYQDKEGTFHIVVRSNNEYESIFEEALRKSTYLLNLILKGTQNSHLFN